jgi:hypothetical protein
LFCVPVSIRSSYCLLLGVLHRDSSLELQGPTDVVSHILHVIDQDNSRNKKGPRQQAQGNRLNILGPPCEVAHGLHAQELCIAQ